jgi:Uncharacterized protein conserved in bacteria
MEVYRDIIYRNLERMIGNLFPVLKKITPDDRWHAMVHDFFRIHQCHSPLFNKIPQEFLQYLEHERDITSDPPFILELAHYEWVDYAVSIDVRDIEWDGVDSEGDLLAGIPVISPLAWPLQYRFPVHTIRPEVQPEQAPEQPTYIVVYRDRNDKVGFVELNPVSARLLELIKQDQNLPGRELLETISRELRHPNPDVVIQGGLEIMQNLRQKDIILGIKA